MPLTVVKVDSTSSAARGTWKRQRSADTALTPERHASARHWQVPPLGHAGSVAEVALAPRRFKFGRQRGCADSRGPVARCANRWCFTRAERGLCATFPLRPPTDRRTAARAAAAGDSSNDCPQKSRRCPRRAPRAPRLLHTPKTRNTTANVGLRVKVRHCGSGLGAVSSATNAAFRAELELAAQARPVHSQAAPRAKRAEYPHRDEHAAARRRVAACGFNTTVWRTPLEHGPPRARALAKGHTRRT